MTACAGSRFVRSAHCQVTATKGPQLNCGRRIFFSRSKFHQHPLRSSSALKDGFATKRNAHDATTVGPRTAFPLFRSINLGRSMPRPATLPYLGFFYESSLEDLLCRTRFVRRVEVGWHHERADVYRFSLERGVCLLSCCKSESNGPS